MNTSPNDKPKSRQVKSVPLDLAVHEQLAKLAENNGCKIKEFATLMVDYFTRTGIDPKDPESTNLKEAIKNLQKENNRVIGFIKQQEKTKLNPILDEMALGMMAFKTQTEQLKKLADLEGWFERVISNQKRLNESFKLARNEEKQKAVRLFNAYLEEQEWGERTLGGKYVKDPTALNEKYSQLFRS